MALLELNGLSKKYAGNQDFAVDQVSLSIHQGEIIALLGESGSGKTTLLRLIAGFERAQSGNLTVNNQTLIDSTRFLPPEKRNIGMVFQDYALFPHMTVVQNVAYGIKKNKAQKSTIVHEMLALVGLVELANRYPHQLSGGQQQRIALARALATKPHLLLLDEPFSNLDEGLKEQVRNDLKNILKQSGITAIFVTHDTRDALAVADRIAILKDGKVQQFDTPLNIYRHPNTQYVAQYFGRVNWLPAKISAAEISTSIGKFPTADLMPQAGNYLLGIRPESIVLAQEKNQSLTATISSCKFFGNYQEAQLHINGIDLAAHFSSQLSFTIGQQIPVSVNHAELILLSV
ncbi:MAG: ABC transporter ATP-binding protein [Flammeovirgaceae bacterium]